jgi:hypothetical protein
VIINNVQPVWVGRARDSIGPRLLKRVGHPPAGKELQTTLSLDLRAFLTKIRRISPDNSPWFQRFRPPSLGVSMASYPEANATASADDVTTPTAPQHQHHHDHEPPQHEQFKPLSTPPSHDQSQSQSHDHNHNHNHHHDHNHSITTTTTAATTALHAELYDDSNLASPVPVSVPVTVTAVAHHGLQVLQAASAAPMSPTSDDLAQRYAQSAALQMTEPQYPSSLTTPSLTAPIMGTHASHKVTRLRRACDMCSQRKVKVCCTRIDSSSLFLHYIDRNVRFVVR